MLFGLKKTITKSASAANLILFSIISQGVNKSERLITAKSWVRGEPSNAPPELNAGIPGTISILTLSFLSKFTVLASGRSINKSRALHISKASPAIA